MGTTCLGTNQHGWQEVWGQGGNSISKNNAVGSTGCGMLPGSSPKCASLSASSPSHLLWTLRLVWGTSWIGKEGRGGWKNIRRENQRSCFISMYLQLDHRGTVKRRIQYWCGRCTDRNPWLLQEPQAGSYARLQHPLKPSYRTRAWATVRPGADGMDQTLSRNGVRPQLWPTDHDSTPCSLLGQATRQFVPPGCDSGHGDPQDVPALRWQCPPIPHRVHRIPLGALCPPCPRVVRATRGHWNITEALKRSASCAKGGSPIWCHRFPRNYIFR